MASAEDGLAFETLEAGPARHYGRATLLGCLSTLEESGLVQGRKHAQLPLLSHVRITNEGLERIETIIQTALASLQRQLTT